MDLLAVERMEIYKVKSVGNHVTIRWTARLIPKIRPLICQKFGKATQMLWGHEYFGKYLHRMGKIVSPYCPYEEGEGIDDTGYPVFCTDVRN